MNDEHKLSDGLVALCSIIVGSDKIIGQSEPWTVENQFSSAALGPSGWAIEMGWSTSYFFGKKHMMLKSLNKFYVQPRLSHM